MKSVDEKRALKVFLCHIMPVGGAHSDKDAVKSLYARLKREGVDVWLDKKKLLPHS
ncbi:MAG: toll/interleukin-1 receptor domain-containing protein [Chloroflexi bacterium]|nr:toll/interleukin-1 receptor domain-containing protein [Chloroflexota bacterium]